MFPKRAIFLRLGQKMSRNTHAFALPDNDQITLAPYSCTRRAGTKEKAHEDEEVRR
jgi:hypothetical protein